MRSAHSFPSLFPRRGAASFNKPDAANPAIASRFHSGCPWRGVADPGRSAEESLFGDPPSLRRAKMLTKEFFAPFFALLGEQDRFCLPNRIADHPLMKSAQCIPVMAFPCATTTVEREEEKREYHLVDFVFVVVHTASLSFLGARFNRVPINTTLKKAPNHTLDRMSRSAVAWLFQLCVRDRNESQK